MLDALPRDVGEWSITEALSKSMEEMPAAQSCGASKVNDPDSGADVGRNVRGDALLLPRCETTSNRGFGLEDLLLIHGVTPFLLHFQASIRWNSSGADL